jgi:hypothetical protein
MDPDERDTDLLADDAHARLMARREASLRGTWDQPGEYLDSAHEDDARAEAAAQAAAEAGQARLDAEADAAEAALDDADEQDATR